MKYGIALKRDEDKTFSRDHKRKASRKLGIFEDIVDDQGEVTDEERSDR